MATHYVTKTKGNHFKYICASKTLENKKVIRQDKIKPIFGQAENASRSRA